VEGLREKEADMSTVFRPHSPSESLHSDRSSGDRQRHRKKIREAIRENIADVVAEQSIIGRDGDTIIKVPIRGIKEYQFIYGDNTPGVGQGDGTSEEGQIVGKAGEEGAPGDGGGDKPGVDYYETDVTIEEIIDLMFEDLELPDMERKALRETIAHNATKRKGYKRKGIRAHLDRKRTARARIGRKIASERAALFTGVDGKTDSFPFYREDQRFRRRKPDIAYESNAVVICVMDTSGSMGPMKKYLARSFFFLLYQFVRTRYDTVDLVFIAHDADAREVTEEEFFTKGESGGTMISSGYAKALEVIENRYHPSLWNVYMVHCSDGDNFSHDNSATLKLLGKLTKVCKLVGYNEIRPANSSTWGSSMMQHFDQVEDENFRCAGIDSKEDVWAAFKTLLAKEHSS